MKKFFKMLCTVIVTAAVTVCGMGTVIASATDGGADSGFTVKITNSDDLKNIRKWWNSADSYDSTGATAKDNDSIKLDKNGFFTATYSSENSSVNGKFTGVTITLDSTSEWSELEDNDQRAAVQQMIKKISEWSLSESSNKKLTTKLTNSQDIPFSNADAVAALFNQGADITGAMSWFAPFSGPVGIILGIGVVIIMVLLIFSTVMDLVYIGIPMAQVAMTKAAGEQGKDAPFGVSVDAVKIVQEKADNGKGGGNVYLQYFKRRILTYIILALCILYLVSGSLGGLISGLLNMVSGITGG